MQRSRWDTRPDREQSQQGPQWSGRDKEGRGVPYPRMEVLDLEPVGFDLLLEDVVLSYLLFQLRHAGAVLSCIDLFLCKRSQGRD